jgi:hypothetical protein
MLTNIAGYTEKLNPKSQPNSAIVSEVSRWAEKAPRGHRRIMIRFGEEFSDGRGRHYGDFGGNQTPSLEVVMTALGRPRRLCDARPVDR